MVEITRKQQFTGKVVKTTLAGAIVDIGLDKLGIVHISNIQKEPVKKVADVLEAGQEVNVWVRRILQDANHLDLTMIEPLGLEWREIKKGMSINGSVVKIEKFGVFIDIGAERPGLCHISELTHDYIRNADEVVKVGEDVEVKILDYNRRKKQIKLSIKALQEAPMSYIKEEKLKEEPVLTAMEIAYRKAMDEE